jgi:hypothetical protein
LRATASLTPRMLADSSNFNLKSIISREVVFECAGSLSAGAKYRFDLAVHRPGPPRRSRALGDRASWVTRRGACEEYAGVVAEPGHSELRGAAPYRPWLGMFACHDCHLPVHIREAPLHTFFTHAWKELGKLHNLVEK